MVAKGGLDAESVGKALAVAAGQADNRGLQRFSLMPIIGSSDIEDAEIDLVSLSSLPDGFDEETWTVIAMAAIALAFGVDAREIWPQQQSGATKADAVLSHIKQRGKGPGHIIAETERMFNGWYLPRNLRMVFDFQDDAQDRQRAEISVERAKARQSNLEFEVTGVREERLSMVTDGSLTDAQFKNLELKDGRLPDGKPLDTLFFREEPAYTEILTLPGIPNPTDIRANDVEKVLDAISSQRTVALKILSETTGEIKKRQTTEALAALDFLAEEYRLSQFASQEETEPDGSLRVDSQEGQRRDARGADSSSDDERIVTAPSQEEGSADTAQREIKQRTFLGLKIGKE
jgi:hypothetical protein